jgi:hypothetical protein
MIQRRSLSLPLLVMAAFFVARPALAAASKPEPSPIQIEVISVTASNSTLGMDPELKKTPWTQILRSLFAYQSYQMDSQSTQRTICRRMLTFSLPGGIILHVAPMKIDGERIEVIIDMFDAERPRMMNMHARLENGATLILGGPHYPPGMMIVMLNVAIVGMLPPALPHLRLPSPPAPQAQGSPATHAAPELEPAVPGDPDGGLAPISTHP